MTEQLTDALDRIEAGDWDRAHDIAQADDTAHGAWLHAHLHRVEGDADNAGYWYRRAGRPFFDGSEEDERAALRASLET